MLASLVRAVGEVHADQFLVVPHEYTAPGEGRITPHDLSAECLVGRFEDVESVQFLVAVGRQPGQDQVAQFVEEEESVRRA